MMKRYFPVDLSHGMIPCVAGNLYRIPPPPHNNTSSSSTYTLQHGMAIRVRRCAAAEGRGRRMRGTWAHRRAGSKSVAWQEQKIRQG